MKLIYCEIKECSNEPNQKILEESGDKKKVRYDFDYKVSKKEVLKSGKEHITTQILQGKSKVKLSPGFQFLEIEDGVIQGKYWMVVVASHQKIGK